MSKKESKHGSTLENHAAGPKNRKQGCSESRKMQQKDMAVLSIPTKSWAAQHAAGSLWMPIICFQDGLIIQHSLLGAGQCTLQRDFFFFPWWSVQYGRRSYIWKLGCSQYHVPDLFQWWVSSAWTSTLAAVSLNLLWWDREYQVEGAISGYFDNKSSSTRQGSPVRLRTRLDNEQCGVKKVHLGVSGTASQAAPLAVNNARSLWQKKSGLAKAIPQFPGEVGHNLAREWLCCFCFVFL